MTLSRNIRALIGFILPLALTSCMNPEKDATGITSATDVSKSQTGIDAAHGGARVVLPEIDLAALGKLGPDSVISDTMPKAWFELTISGPNMADIHVQYPLGNKAGYTFEIKAIPAGKNRSFHGRLLNRLKQATHEGTTLAEIRAGEFADIHLFLAKASGSANVCVTIEGQKPPACATDTLPPPQPQDTGLVNHCWYVGSDSITGQLSLYAHPASGYAGVLVTNTGIKLPVTTWASIGDTLSVIVIRAGMDKKWRLSGVVQNGALWTGSVVGTPFDSTFSFYGKPIPCVEDSIVVPPKDSTVWPPKDSTVWPPKDTTVWPPKDSIWPPKDTVLPPKDTGNTGYYIPSPSSSAGEITLCFEMLFDLASGCEIEGYAKMSFIAGKIVRGNILVADFPSRSYSQVHGGYDQSNIHFESVMPGFGVPMVDSMAFSGGIGNGNLVTDRTHAKGYYTRFPSGKKGVWNMAIVACGSWSPKYPDSSCFAEKVSPKK